ncbi:MAG: hypothetical protein ABSH36_07785 [Solirubrobacteraceae bacterium]
MWRVHVKAHDVRRWHVPERVAVVPAVSAEAACALVVGWALTDAQVPPLRSLTAISLAYATAEPVPEVTA